MKRLVINRRQFSTFSLKAAGITMLGLTALETIFQAAAEDTNISATAGTGMDFKSGRISISNSKIQVELLVGEDKKRWSWTPSFIATKSSRDVETPLGSAKEYVTTDSHPDGFELKLFHTVLADQKTETLRCELTNHSKKAVRLGSFILLDGQLDYQGAARDWMVSALIPGYHDSATIARKLGSTTLFVDDLTIYSNGGKTGVMIAPVRGEADLPCSVKVDGAGRARIRVVSDMSDIVLDPNETRSSEEAYVSFAPWRTAGLDRARWLAATLGDRTKREPPYGWCSWYAYGQHVTGKDMLDMAGFAKTHRADAPFNMLLIDEGYQVGRENWVANGKFPEGMAYYAGEIKQAVPKAGIWMAPIRPNTRRIVNGRLEEFQLGPGEVVRVFPESWYEGYAAGKPGKSQLDPTNPDVQAYIRRWLVRTREEGYNLFKLDFTDVPDSRDRYNNKMTRFQVQRDLFRQYRAAIGEDAYLLICCAVEPQRSVVGIADAKRIGPDTLTAGGFDGRKSPKEIQHCCLLNGIKRMVSAANENGALFCGDPDVTYAGAAGGVTEPQMQVFQTFVGLFGGAAYFGGRLSAMPWTPEKLRWLSMLHPVAREKGHPFAGGWDYLGQQFGMEVRRPWGDFVDVLIWHGDESNEHPRAMGIADVPTTLIGRRFHAYDFWNDKYIGIIDPNYTRVCQQFEGQLLRLTPIAAGPQLVGSNLHLTMGAAEIQSVQAGADSIVVELVASAGTRNGTLTFVNVQPLKLDAATHCQAKASKVGSNVYSLTLAERSPEQNQRVRLKVVSTASG